MNELERKKFKIKKIDDVKRVLVQLFNETYEGTISTPVSAQCQRILSTLVEVLKQSELEERIKKIEKEVKHNA